MSTRMMVGLLAVSLVIAGCGNSDAPTSEDAHQEVYVHAVVGLCAVSDELESSGDVQAAHDVFLDHAHQPLHELAAALEDADRAVAAELLRAIEKTDSDLDDEPTQAAAQAEVEQLTDAAVKGLRVLSVNPPGCAQ